MVWIMNSFLESYIYAHLPGSTTYSGGVSQIGIMVFVPVIPPKLVSLSAIRRPSYKTMVALNIYITACYVGI